MADTIECIVELYSGRVNPRLVLAADEWEEVRRRLEAARGSRLDARPEPPYLGFRGFVIYNPALDAGLPFKVEIYGGFIDIVERAPSDRDAGRALHYADVGGLEPYLHVRADERGFSAQIAAMRAPPRAR